MKISNAIVIFSSVLFSSAATAGSVLELATSEYAQGPPILGTVQVTTEDYSSRLEIASISSDETGGLIYNGDRDEIMVLDHDRQEYYVITQEQIELIAGQVEERMQQMEEALAELPTEEREFARKMMEAQMPAKKADTSGGTLRKTGKTDTIAGYDCDYYDVLKGELKIRDLCVTGWDDFPEGLEVAGAMQELGEFFASMRKAFAKSGGLDLMDSQREMIAYMKELNGYPIRYRDYDAAGELLKETLLTGAHNEEVSATLFEPPENYQRKDLH
jgi:Domain of unknown function (DUF4412)